MYKNKTSEHYDTMMYDAFREYSENRWHNRDRLPRMTLYWVIIISPPLPLTTNYALYDLNDLILIGRDTEEASSSPFVVQKKKQRI